MTAAELRDLLAEVEKHGGPVRVYSDRSEGVWVTLARGVHARVQALADGEMEGSTYYLVGVLKRDLIERGKDPSARYDGLNIRRPWIAEVRRRNHAPVLDGQFFGHGDTELEAVLRAWLAAAKAEGWTR